MKAKDIVIGEDYAIVRYQSRSGGTPHCERGRVEAIERNGGAGPLDVVYRRVNDDGRLDGRRDRTLITRVKCPWAEWEPVLAADRRQLVEQVEEAEAREQRLVRLVGPTAAHHDGRGCCRIPVAAVDRLLDLADRAAGGPVGEG